MFFAGRHGERWNIRDENTTARDSARRYVPCARKYVEEEAEHGQGSYGQGIQESVGGAALSYLGRDGPDIRQWYHGRGGLECRMPAY